MHLTPCMFETSGYCGEPQHSLASPPFLSESQRVFLAEEKGRSQPAAWQ